MTTTLKAEPVFELVFYDSLEMGLHYKRLHLTAEAAAQEAKRVLAQMPARSAHPAMIYGPDLPNPAMIR